jgi:hypothetical protein
MDDEFLYPPFASGDTLQDPMRRLGGISGSGNVSNVIPGWDWSVIITGLEGAIRRYESGLGSHNGISSRAAVGEALWWVAAADEFIRKRVSSNMPLGDYCPKVHSTKAGRRLTGLVYLRNRAGHQLAVVLQQSIASKSADFNVIGTDGTVTVNTLTAHIGINMRAFDVSPAEGYYFTSANSLPSADPAFRERNGRDSCYEELIASQPVSGVLESVIQSLNQAISWEWAEGHVSVKVNGSGSLPT